MTASKIYYRATVTVISDCVPEKVAYLKGTLVFQPTILFLVVGHCILIASTRSK